jgi:hypothetical protein
VTAVAAGGPADPWDPAPMNLPDLARAVPGLARSLGTALTRAWWWVTDLPARMRPVPDEQSDLHPPSDRGSDLDSGPRPPSRLGRHAMPMDLTRELPEIRALVAAGDLDPSVLASVRPADVGYWGADPADDADAIALAAGVPGDASHPAGGAS